MALPALDVKLEGNLLESTADEPEKVEDGSIPKELGSLQNLKYLSLGNNQLTSIPVELRESTTLDKLTFEHNPLESSSEGGGPAGSAS